MKNTKQTEPNTLMSVSPQPLKAETSNTNQDTTNSKHSSKFQRMIDQMKERIVENNRIDSNLAKK